MLSMGKTEKKEKANRMKGLNKKQRKLLFSCVVVALPILQFLIFYIYVNFNSIIMAMHSYGFSDESIGYQVKFVGFDNFVVAWKKIFKSFWMLKNSLIIYLLQLVVGLSLAVVFSYYIYKKRTASGIFNVILFMPQILSSIVLALLFKYLVTNAYPQIVQSITGNKVSGLLDNNVTKMGTVLFYDVWVGFGVNVLLFSGAMASINPSIVESSKLDGANAVREFFSITMPLIWRTYTTFVVVGIAGFFTNQMHLFALFGASGERLSTIGYYMYISTLNSSLTEVGDKYLNYPQLSALGLICTFIVLPVTLIVKNLMNKVVPED